MIIVHIDITEDGHSLAECYRDRREDDILLLNPDWKTVADTLRQHPDERLMCLGHGSRYGLFGCVSESDFVIDSFTSEQIGQREVIGIWCYAKEFGKSQGLKGFFTGMFVSNPAEAEFMGFGKVDKDVTMQQNLIFARKINMLVKDNVPLSQWLDHMQDYDRSLSFVNYNYQHLEYLSPM